MSATHEAESEEAGEQHRSVLKVVLSAPRPVWVLVAGVFINRTGSFFSTFLVLFLKQLGFTVKEMPLVLLCVGAAIPVGSLVGGWAADRFSRRASLVGSTALATGGLALIGFSPNRDVALAGVFVAALFAQAYLPAASALLVDHTQERDRVPIFAFFRLALNLGAALGPVVAALLSSHGLKLLFLVSACCYAVFSAVLWTGLRTGPVKDAEGPASAKEAERAVRGHQRTPAVMLAFYAAVLGITVVYVQYSSTVSLAVSAAHSTEIYATLLTLNGLLVIAAEVPLSSWTRRLPWWIPVTLGTACMAVGIAVSGAFKPYALVAVGVVVWSVGEMLFSPVVSSAVAELSPPDRIGRYQGYLATVQATAFALGPALGTFVYGYSTGVLWAGCLAVGALACGAVVFAGRTAHRPEEKPIAVGA
ncbi:MFS transporter [Streptacidiphilus griseoplanus]|uniref:MFS transporter n=1 Tax=Peterkaempfera griseoplana TaxID=66896 RepID=UPI0006E34672|nr:MFS transporter [Peterkaempfera griseoplana]BCN13440.1 major facilitator superfamily (MFS) transporter [Peterkaempfera griseoplana]